MICDFGMCDGVWRLGASNGRYSSHTNGTNNKMLALFMVALFHPSFLTSARFLPESGTGRVGTPPRQLPHRQPPDEPKESDI